MRETPDERKAEQSEHLVAQRDTAVLQCAEKEKEVSNGKKWRQGEDRKGLRCFAKSSFASSDNDKYKAFD